MVIDETSVLETETRRLYGEFEGKVFHATSCENFSSILASGAIFPGSASTGEPLFKRVDGFFRAIGCVSFFDYRDMQSELFREHQFDCHPFDRAGEPPFCVALLFLNPSQHRRLVPWTSWRGAEHKGQVVPGVEAGYPGNVGLKCIDRTLLVHILENPGGFAAMYRAATRSRRR